MPEIKEPHLWVGRDVMCIDDRPWPNNLRTSEVKLYHIYRVSKAAHVTGSRDFYLENLKLAYKIDRFIDVSDWPEEYKLLNRA